jgi:hypothetical protein
VNATLKFYSLFVIAVTLLVCGISAIDNWTSNSDGIRTMLVDGPRHHGGRR